MFSHPWYLKSFAYVSPSFLLHSFAFSIELFQWVWKISLIIHYCFSIPWSPNSWHYFPISYLFSHQNISKYAEFQKSFFFSFFKIIAGNQNQNLGHIRQALHQWHASSANAHSFMISCSQASMSITSVVVFKVMNSTDIHELHNCSLTMSLYHISSFYT